MSTPVLHDLSSALLRETLNQVSRDLNLEPFAIPEGELGDLQRQEIWQAVYQAVSELLQGSSSALQQTFYRVDLAESQFREALRHSDPAARLSEFVLKRCLQKAVLRRRFSGSSNS